MVRATIKNDGGGGGRVRSPRRREDSNGGAAPPPLMPAAASYDNGEYNDEYKDDDNEYGNDVFPDDDLYRQWCPAHCPASLVYALSSCLPYGSEVVLRFRNPCVLTSLARCPDRGGGGSDNGGSDSETTGNPDRARDAVLCYRDRIVLPLCATRRVLGVRRAERRMSRPTPKCR